MNLETTREVQSRVQQAPSHLYEDAYSSKTEARPRTEQRSTTQLPERLLPGAQIGSCGSINLDCSPAARNWRPAAPDSAQGRAWEQRAERQRNAPLERDEAGRYVIKDGDSLGRIAERMLREQKPGASRRDVQEGIQRILEANPALKCNPDLIRRGQVIVIPGRGGTQLHLNRVIVPHLPIQPDLLHRAHSNLLTHLGKETYHGQQIQPDRMRRAHLNRQNPMDHQG
ncbi:MAG: LysM peptidoglycan-binding domain-containing protein [Candidatus Obscuribacter sp.]|nr:LysM peptidoglycan-binding domain-containing protein [Candidatus Obscuribacter sp.]